MRLSKTATSEPRHWSGHGMGPFLLDDLPALREKLARAGHDQTTMGRMWDSVRRSVRVAPQSIETGQVVEWCDGRRKK